MSRDSTVIWVTIQHYGNTCFQILLALCMGFAVGCSERAAPTDEEKSRWAQEWSQERAAGACLKSRQSNSHAALPATTRPCTEQEPCYTQSDGLKFVKGDACSNNTPNGFCGMDLSRVFGSDSCTWETSVMLPELTQSRCLCMASTDDASRWYHTALANMRRKAWTDCGFSLDGPSAVASGTQTSVRKILRECLEDLVDSGRASEIAADSGFRVTQ